MTHDPIGEQIVITREHSDVSGNVHFIGEVAHIYKFPADLFKWPKDIVLRPGETLVIFGRKLPPVAVKDGNFKTMGKGVRRGVIS